MRDMKKRKILIILVLTGIFSLLLYIFYFEFKEEIFRIDFLHLNRGRSIFIQTPHNGTILIDGGQTGDIIRELTNILPFYTRRIDLVVMTNSAPKNVGGMGEVLKRFNVGKIIIPQLIGTSTALEYAMNIASKKSIIVERVEKGDEWEIDGVTFTVLFPDSHFNYNKTSLPELVLRLEYGSTTMLFLGDVSKTIQKSLIPQLGKIDLVEFAHSVADSRVSSELVNKLKPNRFIMTRKKTNQTSLTRKKFDIDSIDPLKVTNLEQGTWGIEFK